VDVLTTCQRSGVAEVGPAMQLVIDFDKIEQSNETSASAEKFPGGRGGNGKNKTEK